MLEHWHEFYTLLGTAAAALVALLFVAASIATGRLSIGRGSPTRTFTTPVIVHFTYILFVSLVALVPVNTDVSLAVIVGIGAAASFVYAAAVMVRVLRSSALDIDDRLAYGLGAPIAYALTIAAAVLIGEGSAIGSPVLAGALVFLLLINIRNAWDLMVFFVARNDRTGSDAN
jgi:hypothetical protein